MATARGPDRGPIAINPAVSAAANRKATIASTLPVMPRSWVTSSAPAVTKLPVTCATNNPNKARNV